jgi:lysophospholipase L1-like esterase
VQSRSVWWIARHLCPALAGLLVLADCGAHSPPGPSPPSVETLSLTCPSNIQIENVMGATLPVTYSSPQSTGGLPPISITCAPASGADFALGASTVTCNGTDARTPPQSAACSFTVTLTPFVPVLGATKFLAFGDSITEGENGEDVPQVLFVDPLHSYPTLLAALLTARYTGQTPQVLNAGVGGETVAAGVMRIDRELDQTQPKPEVLLLLEGVNSLTGNFSGDSASVITGLRYDIQAAKSRGLKGVFLSTLIPENKDASGCPFRAHDWDEIPQMNGAIRGLAIEQGIPLVDSYAAFGGHPEYIDCDGLHPTPAGNQAIAQAFFTAIQAKLENAAPSTSAILPARIRRRER